VAVLSFAVFLVIAPPNVDRLSVKETENELIKQTGLASAIFADSVISASTAVSLQAKAVRIGAITKSRITLIDPAGKVLADTETPALKIVRMDNHLSRPEIVSSRKTGEGVSKRYSATLKKELIYAATPVKKSGKILGYVRLAKPLNYVEEIKNGIYGVAAVSIIFALAFAMILSIFLSGYLSYPVERLKQISSNLLKDEKPKAIIKKSMFEIGDVERSIEQISENLFNATNTLKLERARLSAVLSSMKDCVIATDKNLKVILMNNSAEKLFGVHFTAGSGLSIMETIRNSDINEMATGVIRTGEAVEKEISFIGKEELILLARASSIKTSGQAAGAVIVLSDTTKVKKLEGYRSEFLANISHELKTPLSVIISSAETLLNGALNDTSNNMEFVLKIERHSKNLLELIKDILDLSDLEYKKDQVNFAEVDLLTLAKVCTDELSEKAKMREIRFLINSCEGSVVFGDGRHIKRAVNNLLDNALNYSDPGGTVSVEISRDSLNTRLKVKDMGIGISKEHLKRIFERFYRIDAARSRDTGGTGLGLAIVKHVMDLHNGHVLVESEPGKGSTFTLVFPKR
jgi:two-component system phosphate regulon sensor histidine kinase PhoR